MATAGLEQLAAMEYPGRFIIVGRNPADEHNVVVYGITGRSESSRTRRLELSHQGVVRTEVTHPQSLGQSSSSLLLYPAFFTVGEIAVVGNGVQTELLYAASQKPGSKSVGVSELLHDALRESSYRFDPQWGWIDVTSYEPDLLHTPRICAAVKGNDAMFWRARREQSGEKMTERYPLPLIAGEGQLLATYDGDKENPKPNLESPLDMLIQYDTAREMAEAVYAALSATVRVSVLAAYLHFGTTEFDPQQHLCIQNRCDLEET